MKRLVLLLILAFVGPLAAQQAVLSKDLESKHVDIDNLANGNWLGTHNGLDCWVFEGKKHIKHVVLTDQNLETLHVVDIPRSNNAEVLAATLDGNYAAVLLVDRSVKRQTTVLSCRVNLDSLVAFPTDTVELFTYGKKDQCFVWAATSSNGKYTAMVSIVRMTESMQYRTEIIMFDGGLRTLWDKEFALGSMHNMLVTDDGRIVTLGLEEGEYEDTRFIFNILTQTTANSYAAVVRCDPVKEIQLAAVNGSHALAMGTFLAEDGKSTGGIIAMSFNIDSAVLSNFLLRPFMNEDVNIFYNKATKKVQREQRADHVRTLACVPTSYGAMMVAGRAFRTENAESNGTLTSVSYAAGLHCLAIDNDGKLLWVKNIRRSDMQKKGDDLIKVSLLSDGSNAYIVKSEHPKAPLDYAIAKEAKTLELGNKSNLIIYTLNPLGEVQKLLVEAKTKHSHLRAIRRSDGVFALYSANGNKVRQAQLKFTK